jgi:hypothetical protein
MLTKYLHHYDANNQADAEVMPVCPFDVKEGERSKHEDQHNQKGDV